MANNNLQKSFFKGVDHIPWENDINLLRNKLQEIFLNYGLVNPNDELSISNMNLILSDDAIQGHWARAFIHENIKEDFNYELLEFKGDSVTKYMLTKYITQRFGDLITEDIGSTFLSIYAAENFQIKLSQDIGLDKLVIFNPNLIKEDRVILKIKEDVFESFMGCLDEVGDKYIGLMHGSVYCYNFICNIFNKVDIKMEDIKKDAKIIIKQIFDGHRYGVVQYDETNSDNKSLGAMKVVLRRDTGEVLGIGYGCKNEAKTEAAKNAIKNLERRGITEQSAKERNKNVKSSTEKELSLLTDSVRKNIDKYNLKVRQRRSDPIMEYRIDMISSKSIPEATISVAYGYNNNNLKWRIREHAAEADLNTKEPISAKINVLRIFNNYLISNI